MDATEVAPEEFELLRQRWIDLTTGRARIAAADADVRSAMERLDARVDQGLAAIEASPGGYFADLSHGDDIGLRETARRLQELATAWVSPGSGHEGSQVVLRAAIEGVRGLLTAYGPGHPEFGNWWNWEIGLPQALGTTLAILRPELTARDIADGCAAIDHYVPDPWYQFMGGEPSEGANRVDLCQASIVSAIVARDPGRLVRGAAGLGETWRRVTSGDGFYADGSFIQHQAMAYTGAYGVQLLAGLSLLLPLLAGTSVDVDDASGLVAAVEAAFTPFMVDGQMMDAVRGRSISREHERSRRWGDDLVEAVLRLAGAVDDATATRWRGLCRGWIERDAASTTLSTASPRRLALVKDLLASDVPALSEPLGGRVFASMDRVVYRAPRWAMALAMCSGRIAWSECGNGENIHGALTGQGMCYLYLPHDQRHYDDEFWATSDLWAPAGTTVDATGLPPRVEGEWAASRPTSEWAGGVVLDDLVLAGQHLDGPGGTRLRARKTWLLSPDGVVVLGADVATGTGADIVTTLEHRNLGLAPRELLVDGESHDRFRGGARWLHLEGVAGYTILDAPELSADVSPRTGSWARNQVGASETPITRQYATIRLTGGGTHAYAMWPGADPARTAELADHPPVRVLANDASVQALGRGDVVAMSVWSGASVEGITIGQPACAIVRRSAKGIDLALADPTQTASSLTLVLAAAACEQVVGSDRVSAERHGDDLVVRVDVRGLAGATVSATLQ